MKLTKLKEIVDRVISKHGDMEVYILLNRTENCSECGQPKDRNCESDDVTACALGNGKGGHNFWIEGEVI